jgi:quinol monooxygenase YgiN
MATKSAPMPLTVAATYRMPKAAERKFRALLKAHWPTLRKLKLAGPAKPLILRSEEKGRVTFIEIFDWASAAAIDTAHRTPAVAAVWDNMGGLCRPLGAKPAMEFPHFDRVTAR